MDTYLKLLYSSFSEVYCFISKNCILTVFLIFFFFINLCIKFYLSAIYKSRQKCLIFIFVFRYRCHFHHVSVFLISYSIEYLLLTYIIIFLLLYSATYLINYMYFYMGTLKLYTPLIAVNIFLIYKYHRAYKWSLFM